MAVITANNDGRLHNSYLFILKFPSASVAPATSYTIGAYLTRRVGIFFNSL